MTSCIETESGKIRSPGTMNPVGFLGDGCSPNFWKRKMYLNIG